MRTLYLIFIVLALASCKKDPIVESPNIVGNVYSGFVDYAVFTMGGNISNNKAYKFISPTQLIIIDYVDNTYMPSWMKLDKYVLTSKITMDYRLDFPNIEIGNDVLPHGEFWADTKNLTYKGFELTLVNNSSELGVFLDSVK